MSCPMARGGFPQTICPPGRPQVGPRVGSACRSAGAETRRASVDCEADASLVSLPRRGFGARSHLKGGKAGAVVCRAEPRDLTQPRRTPHTWRGRNRGDGIIGAGGAPQRTSGALARMGPSSCQLPADTRALSLWADGILQVAVRKSAGWLRSPHIPQRDAFGTNAKAFPGRHRISEPKRPANRPCVFQQRSRRRGPKRVGGRPGSASRRGRHPGSVPGVASARPHCWVGQSSIPVAILVCLSTAKVSCLTDMAPPYGPDVPARVHELKCGDGPSRPKAFPSAHVDVEAKSRAEEAVRSYAPPEPSPRAPMRSPKTARRGSRHVGKISPDAGRPLALLRQATRNAHRAQFSSPRAPF
jgi:hypothetical protein